MDYCVQDIVSDLPLTNGGYPRRSLNTIRTIYVHHSVTPSPGVNAVESVERGIIESIHRYHQQIGWPGIGYHFCVFPSGRIYKVGLTDEVRYHTGGEDDASTPLVVSYHNETGIGICLIGDFTSEAPGEEQLGATQWLVQQIRYLIPWSIDVRGHRDVMATACPGDTWEEWRQQLDTPTEGEMDKATLTNALNVLWGTSEMLADIEDVFGAHLDGQEWYSQQAQNAIVAIKGELKKVGIDL